MILDSILLSPTQPYLSWPGLRFEADRVDNWALESGLYREGLSSGLRILKDGLNSGAVRWKVSSLVLQDKKSSAHGDGPDLVFLFSYVGMQPKGFHGY